MYEELEKDYEEMKKKYSYLPPMDELNFEFEISNTADERKLRPKFPLRYVRRCISYGMSNYIGYLHDFILPSPQSAIAMKEYEYFDEEEKQKIINLIARLMRINRHNSRLEVLRDEKEDAKFIVDMFDEWKKFKKDIEPFLKKNVESWDKAVKEQ